MRARAASTRDPSLAAQGCVSKANLWKLGDYPSSSPLPPPHTPDSHRCPTQDVRPWIGSQKKARKEGKEKGKEDPSATRDRTASRGLILYTT